MASPGLTTDTDNTSASTLALMTYRNTQTIEQTQNQLIGTQSVLPPLPNLHSLNQSLTMKLDEDNYLIWKNQLLNVIIANGLEDFIDGSRSCPTRFLDSQMQIVNLDFATWPCFNRLIMS